MRVVVRQRAGLPVMHDQVQIGAALGGAEVRGVGQVVGHIERHPRSVHVVTLNDRVHVCGPRSTNTSGAAAYPPPCGEGRCMRDLICDAPAHNGEGSRPCERHVSRSSARLFILRPPAGRGRVRSARNTVSPAPA
jgi:hypothetical protein